MALVNPAPGFVLIEKDPVPKNVGRIVLAEQNVIRPVSGKILRVGPGLESDYSEGMRVLFGAHAGDTFAVDGEKVTLLHRSEIQAWIPLGAEVSI